MSETRVQTPHLDAMTTIIYGKRVADGDVGYPLLVDGSGALMVNASGVGTSSDIEGGGVLTVGTTAIEITFTGTTRSIMIGALSGNTGTLYIGKSNVTSSGTNAFAFIEAGESLMLDYDDSSNPLYVVATIAGQSYIKGALL